MAGQYKAPLINGNTNNGTDPQYNYYGVPQQQLVNNDAQFNYYGAPTPTQPQPPQQNVSAPPAYNPNINNNTNVVVNSNASGSGEAYSFENASNPKPSAPPDPSEFNQNFGSFSQSNYNMEGYIMRHGNENTNLKIHSPEGYNHNEITQALREDAKRSDESELVQVTGRGPGCLKGCQQSPHLKSWFLCLVIWVLLVMKLICFAFESSFCETEGTYNSYNDTTYDKETSCDSFCAFTNDNATVFWVVFAIVFLLYIIESGCSSSRRYLSNTFEKDGMVRYVSMLKNENLPRIWWRVECYHYETRYRTVTKTDANGNRRTERESYTEKVVTWTAHETYRYRVCNDISGNFSYETKKDNVVIHHLILQLRLYKTFSFANAATAADYNYKAMLFRWYNDRDVYQDFHYGMELNGFKSNMLGELEPGNKPACMSLAWFWILSLIGLSPCYRLWFSSKCHKKTFLLNKQVSI